MSRSQHTTTKLKKNELNETLEAKKETQVRKLINRARKNFIGISLFINNV